MTNAERQRRYIDENGSLKAEVSKLRACLAELEAAKRRLRGRAKR